MEDNTVLKPTRRTDKWKENPPKKPKERMPGLGKKRMQNAFPPPYPRHPWC
jgi:hypothetical protein